MSKPNEEDYVSASNGGCWFCSTKSEDMAFDTEFDTYVHIPCLKKAYDEGVIALKTNPEFRTEAFIMSYLLEE